jgi:hypothetical protein
MKNDVVKRTIGVVYHLIISRNTEQQLQIHHPQAIAGYIGKGYCASLPGAAL